MELIFYLVFKIFIYLSSVEIYQKKNAVPRVLNGHINTNLQLIDPGIMHLKSD